MIPAPPPPNASTAAPPATSRVDGFIRRHEFWSWLIVFLAIGIYGTLLSVPKNIREIVTFDWFYDLAFHILVWPSDVVYAFVNQWVDWQERVDAGLQVGLAALLYLYRHLERRLVTKPTPVVRRQRLWLAAGSLSTVLLLAIIWITTPFPKDFLKIFTTPIPARVISETPTPLPTLYVATRQGVFRASDDEAEKRYGTLQPFSRTTDVIKINTTQSAVYLYAKQGVQRFDHGGRLKSEWKRTSSPTYRLPTAEETRNGAAEYDELMAGVYDRGKLYIAANRSLIILDEQLRELGHLSPLQKNELNQYKAIDDVLVHDQTAFLVDDIAYPLFVFSVDISNPRQPQLLHTIGVGGVYATISNQWLDRANEDWCFQQETSSGYTGNFTSVACVPKSLYRSPGSTNPDGYGPNDPAIRTIELGESNHEIEPELRTGKGFTILKDLNWTDDWMFIEQAKSYDDQIVGLGSDYSVQAQQSIGTNLSSGSIVFYRYRDHVFLYALDTLNVLRDNGEVLAGEHSQTIPQVEVDRTDGYQGKMKVPAWITFAADPR
ncbi:MAG: hypothetical protein HYY50_05255 [Candidatus Kerfeldbacteria bacterium]|nr:hypothetical protein [Candidatus Kerfeldbacteria bacterium]